MTNSRPKNLTDVLTATGLVRPEDVDKVIEHHQRTGMSIPDSVVELKYATDEKFLQALAEALGLQYVHAGEQMIEPEILDSISSKAVFQYNIIPLSLERNTLTVATHDPFFPGLTDALRLTSGKRIRLTLSTLNEIEKACKKFYGVGADTLERMIQDDRIELAPDEDLLKDDLSELDQEASVVKFVNQIIWEAHQNRATDIHMEPMETDLRIRYRVDGVLRQAPVPPQLKRFQSAIISRIKVMANMDIAEKRLPQDGRISLRIRGEEIDVRVNTMPTVYGESVSLRLLMRSSGILGMDKLGMNSDDREILTKMIHKPHGILLVTGPTGSGKSTTLYTWLHTINTIDKRIITTEDPIEYEMKGVNQVQIRTEIGLTFAEGLRNILRQDPDVIMVGEIRDQETADIAIRAALTGHLVFSTLHTNDAAGAVTRLIDMGIEPFLVASSVECLVAQRLVRRLCNECKRPWPVDEKYLEKAGFDARRMSEGTIYESVGCEACHQSGFSGRSGIYEVLPVTDHIRPLIVNRVSSNEIKAEALRHGMRTLRDDGWRKVLDGVTTVEEVLRVSEEDEEQMESEAYAAV
jgi:type II secretion system protein E